MTENTTTHADLLNLVGAKRDTAAFESLFEHFAPRIKAFMMRRGVASEVADDVAQEAMVNVWRKAHLYDSAKSAPSTWIFTISRNAHIDLVRKLQRPELDPNDPALVPDAAPDAPTMIGAVQDADRVRNAMSHLPEEQREVLMLSFFEDKPHSEIATQLNLPLGTVKSRIRLAFTRMRTRLGDAQ